ncbi:kininogen-1 [Cheilinus undulatus]|uniref:kininogen-1 n=1 Tax=Cheilinus undulatus TaxID=241271 RepID=UPI001BD62A00|nr:kininogen-1 [Cheilinus undulatus]
MRSGLRLCVLGLLCLHSSVFGQDAVQVFCDDSSVEKAVHSAVSKFNEGMSTGHILALYQIHSASKSEDGSDSVFLLEFTSRASDCLAGDSKAWTECEYLPHGHKDPFSCNATVRMTGTEADTTQVDCQLDRLITAGRAPCMGCPEEIDENAEDIKVPISVSISKFNSMSNSTHLFSLHNVGPATRQVVAGLRYKLSFDMRKTICAKAEHNELSEICVHDDTNKEFAYCNSTVDTAPWRLEPPQANIECESGAMPSFFHRRRPPGWSPLRGQNASPSATVASTVPPAKASKTKEESSEEVTKAKQSASNNAESTNTFHCPSNPWKAFSPLMPSAVGPSDAPAEAGFKDSDLLG